MVPGPGATGGRAPGGARSEATRRRVLEATFECVAEWGLAKTTVDDAARRAGVSRATLYRYFPGGRDELIAAVVAFEFARFFDRLYEEIHDATTLEEVLERGIGFAHHAVRAHAVLQRILRSEPELLEPTFSTEGNAVLAEIALFLTPYLETHELAPGVDVPEAADFLARMGLSYIMSPGRWDLADPAQLARLVRVELLGGIAPAAAR